MRQIAYRNGKQAGRELEMDDTERRFDEKLEKIARSPVRAE